MAAVIWRFRISQGEWVCATCGQPMVEDPDGDGVTITHAENCEQVTGR